MSIQTELTRIITAVGNAYSKVSEKGGTMPASQTVANLATAIDSIPAGGGAPSLQSKSATYTTNGTNTITPDEGYDGLSSVDVTVNVASGGGGGIIEGLQLMREYFSFKATDVIFNNCSFKDGATVEFWSTSTNVSFTKCLFENIIIRCTQSIRDAIENDSSNFVENVQFDIVT